jgi:type II secretory pathway component PulF
MAFIIVVFIFAVALFLVPLTIARRRRVGQEQFMSLLAHAARRGIPLTSVFTAAVSGRRGLHSGRLPFLAALLGHGVPLPDALKIVPGLAPRRAISLIRLGWNCGSLEKTLGGTTDRRSEASVAWQAVAGRLMYLVVLATFATGIISFYFIKIIPAMVKIFKDFGAEIPIVTRLVMFSADYVIESGLWLPTFAILAFAVVYVGLRASGLTEWTPYPLNRLTRRLHTATILDGLAIAVEKSYPIDRALASLVPEYPERWIQRRLSRAQAHVLVGVDWVESLRMAKLIGNAELATLQAAQRCGNLPWALREIAEGNRRRLVERVQVAINVLFPAAIIAYGAVVGFFVVGTFVPLVALIQRLT